MRSVRAAWAAYLDRQHRQPSGALGLLVGERMLRQHAPETAWSVELLRLGPGQRVLEIGCGAGRALQLCTACAGRLVGLDRSPAMLRAAAWRNRGAQRRGQLALLRGDLARLPFGPAGFDRLLSIHTFYFWPDPPAVCEQLLGLLAPGGRLVCTFATARRGPDGAWAYWEIHRRAEALAERLGRRPGLAVALLDGPDSRQFNNRALVIDTPGARPPRAPADSARQEVVD